MGEGRTTKRPGSERARGDFKSFTRKSFWNQGSLTLVLGRFPVLADEALGRLSEGLDNVVLADALSGHHSDGLSLGLLTSLDLDGLEACEFFERRTDALLTSGSSDTREGGLVFDVRTIGDAQHHNCQEGDEVVYFHCYRTDGVDHPRGIIRRETQISIACWNSLHLPIYFANNSLPVFYEFTGKMGGKDCLMNRGFLEGFG